MCVQFFHMVSIDEPAGVGAPSLNTTSHLNNSTRGSPDYELKSACVTALEVLYCWYAYQPTEVIDTEASSFLSRPPSTYSIYQL